LISKQQLSSRITEAVTKVAQLHGIPLLKDKIQKATKNLIKLAELLPHRPLQQLNPPEVIIDTHRQLANQTWV